MTMEKGHHERGVDNGEGGIRGDGMTMEKIHQGRGKTMERGHHGKGNANGEGTTEERG